MSTGSVDWNGFVGQATSMPPEKIAAEAATAGVSYGNLRAIMEVEASWKKSGDGFDLTHRPKMLFEPFHFWRNLLHNPTAQAAAVVADVATAYRPAVSYYRTNPYVRLKIAIQIDETAALLSCSWGFGQVLGSNFRNGGWKTVQEMVRACMDSEEAHLQAMLGFIKANHLIDELQRSDAVGFALVYNGAGEARDGYDTKIAAAMRKWAAIEPPHVAPAVLVPSPALKPTPQVANWVLAAQSLTHKSKDILTAQLCLRKLGYFSGTVDGLFGPKTLRALKIFENKQSLPELEVLDEATYEKLVTLTSEA